MALLDIEHLNVSYVMKDKRVRAVEDFSLSLERGKPLGVVGESGSGKSTLANALLRLLPPETEVSGRAIFQDTDLISCSDRELQALRWLKMSVVFQKSMNTLSPVHRIDRQLLDMYRVHAPSADKAEVMERLEQLMELVNLPKRVLRSYPHELSGGMLQRISIAAALMHEPPFLILDEATTALDVITQGQVIREIKRLRDSLDVTWMLITHDISVVSACCDQVVVMYAGRAMEYGPVKRVINHPAHPYTAGLLRSFPTLRGEKKNLRGIPGNMPDLSQKGPGCVFASRCPKATDRCRSEAPSPLPIEDGHFSACFQAGEEAR